MKFSLHLRNLGNLTTENECKCGTRNVLIPICVLLGFLTLLVFPVVIIKIKCCQTKYQPVDLRKFYYQFL